MVSRIVLPSSCSERIASQAVRRAAGSKPGRRLVEEDELGVADEREGEVQAPLLAAGQRARDVVGLLVQAGERR